MAKRIYPDQLDLVRWALDVLEESRRNFNDPGLSQLERIGIVISQGYDDPQFHFSDVEAALGIGERRIRQVLAEGSPPTSFRAEVHERRMIKAKATLASANYLIDYIAYLCGFKCASTFAAHFKKATTVSPYDWRRHYRGTRRAGGTTGCFRLAAGRARAKRDGEEEPPMTRPGKAPGEDAVTDHDIHHALRQARLRGEVGHAASIAEIARAWQRRTQ